MMGKIQIAIDSSYGAAIALSTATTAVSNAVYHWIDVFLPFLIDIGTIVQRNAGPAWTLISPLVLWITGRLSLIGWWMHENIPLKFKLGFALIIFLFSRLEKFEKIFILNIIFFVFSFDFTGWLLSVSTVRAIVFVAVPLVFALLELLAASGRIISPTNASKDRFGNLLIFFTISPIFWAFETSDIGKSFIYGPYGIAYLSVTWAGIVNFFLFLDSQLILVSADRLVDDLGITLVIQKGFIPVGRRIRRHYSESQLPLIVKVRGIISLVNERVIKTGFRIATGENIISIMRLSSAANKWSLITLGIVGVSVLGYFAYTTLKVIAGFAIWPWFFVESIKVISNRLKSEYRAQLSFTLLFLGFELFFVRNSNSLVSFVSGILHFPIIIVLKFAPIVIMNWIVDFLALIPRQVGKIMLAPKPHAPRPEEHAKKKTNGLRETIMESSNAVCISAVPSSPPAADTSDVKKNS